MTITRNDVLNSLLCFSQPTSVLAKSLGAVDWDFVGKPTILSGAHLISVLSRYINGELSAQDIESWANLIEGREDIDFEQSQAQLLNDTIYELANPELTESLSERRAKSIIKSVAQT